jgi:hypothetical protein
LPGENKHADAAKKPIAIVEYVVQKTPAFYAFLSARFHSTRPLGAHFLQVEEELVKHGFAERHFTDVGQIDNTSGYSAVLVYVKSKLQEHRKGDAIKFMMEHPETKSALLSMSFDRHSSEDLIDVSDANGSRIIRIPYDINHVKDFASMSVEEFMKKHESEIRRIDVSDF